MSEDVGEDGGSSDNDNDSDDGDNDCDESMKYLRMFR